MEVNASFPRVTSLLHTCGLVDTAWFTEEARDKGTAVHQAARFLDEGDLDRASVDPNIKGRLEAYERFLFEVKPTILSIEEPVFHQTYRYRGTLDRRVKIGSAEGVLDIKGPTRSPWQALQVQFYAACFPRRLHRWTLHLSDDGTYRLIEHDGRNDWNVCLAVLTLYNWKMNGGL